MNEYIVGSESARVSVHGMATVQCPSAKHTEVQVREQYICREALRDKGFYRGVIQRGFVPCHSHYCWFLGFWSTLWFLVCHGRPNLWPNGKILFPPQRLVLPRWMGFAGLYTSPSSLSLTHTAPATFILWPNPNKQKPSPAFTYRVPSQPYLPCSLSQLPSSIYRSAGARLKHDQRVDERVWSLTKTYSSGNK